MTKKLQLTDLMKNQEQYEVKNDATEDLEIERLEASITIREPERSLIMDSTDLADGGENGHEADAFLVHNIVTEPNLKDKELQKAYGCVEPTDIVHKLFKPGEVSAIAKAGMDLAGYGTPIKKVKDLKN